MILEIPFSPQTTTNQVVYALNMISPISKGSKTLWLWVFLIIPDNF